jgi:hypothetical protein
MLFILFFALTGCSKAEKTGGDISSAKNNLIKNGIQLEIETNQAVFLPDVLVEVTASATNISDQSITYRKFNLQDPPIYTSVFSPVAGTIGLRHPDDPIRVSPAIKDEILQPGETVTRTAFWDQKILNPQIQAPAGKYQVSAVFYWVENPNPEQYIEAKALTVKAEVDLQGGAALVSQDQAMAAVLLNAQAKAWLDLNEGIVCKISYLNQYKIYQRGKWQVSNSEADSEQTPRGKTCSLDFVKGEAWRLNAGVKSGLAPGELMVKIDARSSGVLSSEIISGGKN